MGFGMRTSLALLILVSACGTDTPPDIVGGDGYETLIAAEWTLPPSTEKYLCVRETITEDLWIKSMRPIAPDGTHHAVLMLGAPDAPDGTVECSPSLIKPAIYASGVGAQPLDMPDGVAVHARPGDQLLLNLHLFNAEDSTLSGTAGIEIATTDPVDSAHEAGVVLAGKAAGLIVEPGPSTQVGTCTTPAGMTLFALAPHMHLRGTHMKIAYGTQVVFDEDYIFDEQRFRVMTPAIQTVAGQQFTIECSYFNETAAPLYFGESTNEEMCFALTFVYPRPPSDLCVR